MSENPMVERGARRLYDHRARIAEAAGLSNHGFTWETDNEAFREQLRAEVRDVIEALREPTDRMGFQMARVAYTAQKWHEGDNGDPRYLSAEESERINMGDGLHGNPSHWYKPMWRMAIDAALTQETDK